MDGLSEGVRSLSFRPALIPTLGMLIASGVTARLGVWQLDRYGQAKERVAHIDQTLMDEPVDVGALNRPPEELMWRRARVGGTFEGEPLVATGGIPFGQNGYAVVEPLTLEGGVRLLVLRGWVPSMNWEEHVRLTRQVGPVELEGVLLQIEEGVEVAQVQLPGDTKPLWPLEQETFLGVFTRGVDIPYASMADHLGDDVLPIYLIAGEELEDGEDRNVHTLPADGYYIKRTIFHHIDYAAQWFVMSLIAMGIWAWHGFRRGRSRSNGA